jgi:hypothetical protein
MYLFRYARKAPSCRGASAALFRGERLLARPPVPASEPRGGGDHAPPRVRRPCKRHLPWENTRTVLCKRGTAISAPKPFVRPHPPCRRASVGCRWRCSNLARLDRPRVDEGRAELLATERAAGRHYWTPVKMLVVAPGNYALGDCRSS